MAVAILMPALSPTMSEGNIAKWLKKEGDAVEPGQILAEIETDKAIMEMETVDYGTVGKIFIEAGTSGVKVNQLIAVLLEEGDDSDAIARVVDAHSKGAEGKGSGSTSTAISADATDNSNNKSITSAATTKVDSASQRIFITPLAKRIALQSNLDIKNITGTGPGGRILKRDVLGFSTNTAGGAVGSFSGHKEQIHAANAGFSVEKLSNMRKTIANRLLESKQTIPHFYLSIDCNVDSLMTLRQDLNVVENSGVGAAGAVKISVNDIVIKAAARALAKVPQVNSAWSDDGIILYNRVDISIAVAIDGGLITPIIQDADNKSLGKISSEVKSLVEKAKNNKLRPEEYQGGGFSISNLGMYGITTFNAIINPPQSAILSVGAVIKKPVVFGSELKIGSVMNVSLSCDHRIIDGAKAAEFLAEIKKLLEKPSLLLL